MGKYPPGVGSLYAPKCGTLRWLIYKTLLVIQMSPGIHGNMVFLAGGVLPIWMYEVTWA